MLFLLHASRVTSRAESRKQASSPNMATQTLKNIKCPNCQKVTAWEGNPFRPFCSERCKMIDLGAWAGEEYRIAGDRREEEKDSGQEDEG